MRRRKRSRGPTPSPLQVIRPVWDRVATGGRPDSDRRGHYPEQEIISPEVLLALRGNVHPGSHPLLLTALSPSSITPAALIEFLGKPSGPRIFRPFLMSNLLISSSRDRVWYWLGTYSKYLFHSGVMVSPHPSASSTSLTTRSELSSSTPKVTPSVTWVI